MNKLKTMGVDPVNKVRSLSVDTRVSSLSTSVSPGDNTRQLVSAHEWSTGVTLARVLTSLVKTSTDHGVSNAVSTIRISAVGITDNRDNNLGYLDRLNICSNQQNYDKQKLYI